MTLKELGLDKKNIELSISLIGLTRMQELNKKYRSKNKTTDVLSFKPDDNFSWDNKNSTKRAFVLPKDNVLKLGDIVICPKIAVKQAKKNNKLLKEELALLTVHGLLHLVGYEHEKSISNGKKMLKLQEKIFNKLK